MSNTPSDEEILALAQQHLKAFAQFTGAGEVWFEGEVEFARAVLEKWGTPQPVVREPLTPSQYNIALGCATDIPPSRYEVVTRAIERAHGITQKGGSNAE